MKTTLTKNQIEQLLATLQARFEKNKTRHPAIVWTQVQEQLEKNPANLWTLFQMEETGGEPDVVTLPSQNKNFIFYDCAPESPKGRRSCCYDQAALDARKEHKPKISAVALAKEIGITLLTEEEYIALQSFGPFDLKTSSWLATPKDVRAKGGAIFGDYRYGRTFIYHNGAESYYAARGFRGKLYL